ncbi:MAG: 1,4-dihydroxy-2-naphthoate polyprenyltransferase, partial [Chloroflexota bacterium]
MEQTQPTFTPTQAWLLASRPKTLPAAAAPVLVGIAVAI